MLYLTLTCMRVGLHVKQACGAVMSTAQHARVLFHWCKSPLCACCCATNGSNSQTVQICCHTHSTSAPHLRGCARAQDQLSMACVAQRMQLSVQKGLLVV